VWVLRVVGLVEHDAHRVDLAAVVFECVNQVRAARVNEQATAIEHHLHQVEAVDDLVWRPLG
jgi:hypothetical protein